MDKLIPVEELIKQAQKKKIDLGKGDPYNRLRYYTKIGWIPHMIRKSNDTKSAKGHYPAWVLERLDTINTLKNQGLTNEEISKKISTNETKRTLFTTLKSKETKSKIVTYTPIALLLVVLLIETGVIHIGKIKSQFITETLATSQNNPTQNIVTDSGKQFVPTNNNKQIFVKSDKVTALSKVNVTFETDYAPATRYWIGYIVPGQGFFVELDAPIQKDAQFSWWITE